VIFRPMFDRESCTYTYLIGDAAAGIAALVDTVREHVARDLEVLEQLGLKLTHVLETHVHADHVTGAGELRKRTGARTVVARTDGPECADLSLADGEEIKIGDVTLVAIDTPGHTAGCISYRVGDRGAFDRVLTGDALFIRGCGRTDFQGGDAGRLFDSVTTRLFTLGDATLVYPGHDYRGLGVSTIGEERRHNPRLGGGIGRDAFIAKMAALNLPRPVKIDEALPANRACGEARAPAPPQG
jgi:sulfur dioxygenase